MDLFVFKRRFNPKSGFPVQVHCRDSVCESVDFYHMQTKSTKVTDSGLYKRRRNPLSTVFGDYGDYADISIIAPTKAYDVAYDFGITRILGDKNAVRVKLIKKKSLSDKYRGFGEC